MYRVLVCNALALTVLGISACGTSPPPPPTPNRVPVAEIATMVLAPGWHALPSAPTDCAGTGCGEARFTRGSGDSSPSLLVQLSNDPVSCPAPVPGHIAPAVQWIVLDRVPSPFVEYPASRTQHDSTFGTPGVCSGPELRWQTPRHTDDRILMGMSAAPSEYSSAKKDVLEMLASWKWASGGQAVGDAPTSSAS